MNFLHGKKTLKDNKNIVSIEVIKEETEESYEIDGNLEDQIVLEKHLKLLNPIHEEIIRLRFILDLDYQSISGLLKIPLGTVKSRINTAMNALKRSMKGDVLND